MKNLNVVHNVQKGFTLIELMIVVAIIGILAALAIPAYSDYTLRAKVSEAATLSGSAKTAVDIYYSENGNVTNLTGNVTNNHVTLSLENSTSYTSKYVDSVAVGANGVVTVTMQDATSSGLPADIADDTVIFTPTEQGGNLSWVVDATSSVPAKYRPKN